MRWWQWQQNAGDDGAIVYKVMVMIVVMDLRAMVKVCADVYLIYSFSAWYLKRGCECSHGYPNPVRILI
jgi:hypothetical protein